MNSDLTRLIKQAAKEPSAGPDLARIEADVQRRKNRRRGISAAIVALTVSTLAILAPNMPEGPPAADSAASPEVALLANDPTPEDRSLERASTRSWALDAGSIRLWGKAGDFQYGLATAQSGTQICIVKMEQATEPSIGLVSCKSKSRFSDDNVFAMATNSVPDHLPPHTHIAVAVPDGYTTARYDDREIDIERNMLIISSPPYPEELTIQGASGQRTVALPPIPDPGQAPRTS